jgi:hypothetical protein
VKIPKPINEIQRVYNDLCSKGGGSKGGPARTKIQELLHNGSDKLNKYAFDEITNQLALFPDKDPWKICFAVGLGWGHLADISASFTEAAIEALETLNSAAIKKASTFHFERGPLPIEQSLTGGYSLFQRVRLPNGLPETIKSYGDAQQRWLQPLLSKNENRPRYIGSWNATAMFMVALFSMPKLSESLTNCEVLLPPGGPIHRALGILHQSKILSTGPAGTVLDDQAFEPGALYENNALMVELLKGRSNWSILDVHSGLYMLGTRLNLSEQWA